MMTTTSSWTKLLICALTLFQVQASVFLPSSRTVKQSSFTPFADERSSVRRILRESRLKRNSNKQVTAMAIPGYGVTEQIFVGGFANFLSLYNLIITGRILLSWFPQAQGIGALQPIYSITDPYLNLFRGLLPPLFGLDLSPLLAFFLLSAMQNATAAVGCEIPPDMQQHSSKFGRKPTFMRSRFQKTKPTELSLNL